MKTSRLVAGFAAACLFTSAVVFAFFLTLFTIQRVRLPRMLGGSVADAGVIALYALGFAAVATLIALIPALFFIKKRWTTLSHFVLLGAAVGALPFAATLAYSFVDGTNRYSSQVWELGFLTAVAACGGISAAVGFWWIAIRPELRLRSHNDPTAI
jgi:hypothetical protein